MRLPDGTVLMHGALPYDPQKAHDYYVKTRKLHPRAKGSATYTVKGRNGKTVKLSAKQLEEQKAFAAKRVAQLRKNLSDLGVLLHDKLEKAKASATKAAKPLTLAEKAKAARASEAYAKSHKQEISNNKKTAAAKAPTKAKDDPKSDSVDSLKKEISSTRDKLKNAVAKQRELATAKKNG